MAKTVSQGEKIAALQATQAAHAESNERIEGQLKDLNAKLDRLLERKGPNE